MNMLDSDTGLVHRMDEERAINGVSSSACWTKSARDVSMHESDEIVTCLACLASVREFVSYQEVGIAVLNPRALEKLNFGTNPCAEISLGDGQKENT